MYTFLIFILFTFTSCSMQKPVSMAHVERIEEHVMPVAVGADTIEITLPHTENNWLTERTDNTKTTSLRLSDNCIINNFEQSEKSKFRELRGFREKKNNSVREKNNSVRNKNSVRISSTRGINISRHETDTTQTLRITLRPDTVFLPYTHHIRSDTIVIPDRICKTKMQKTQTANALLILILIAIIIFLLKNRIARK